MGMFGLIDALVTKQSHILWFDNFPGFIYLENNFASPVSSDFLVHENEEKLEMLDANTCWKIFASSVSSGFFVHENEEKLEMLDANTSWETENFLKLII